MDSSLRRGLAGTLLSLAAAAAGCTLFLADDFVTLCDTDADCTAEQGCKSGFCRPLDPAELPFPVDAEGEGDAGGGEGEGEGDIGEGEGEGDIGAGEGEGEGEGEPLPPPRTCREVLQRGGATSGVYGVDLDGDGSIGSFTRVAGGQSFVVDEATVFCEQAADGGGWTRLVLFDGNDAAAACPSSPGAASAWASTALPDSTTKGCARPAGGASQPGVTVPVLHAYAEVRGRIAGVVFGDQDAFAGAGHPDDIDGIYVDGVSLTAGTPREHVFTFVGAHPCYSGEVRCPCDGGSAAKSFVDQSFCDRPGQAARPRGCADGTRAFDPGNPLWDGPTDECAPDDDGFFVRSTLSPHDADDDLEVRIMADQVTTDENLAITRLELYIR